MKKILLLAMLLGIAATTSARGSLSAFIIDKDATNIRSTPSGKVVMKLPHQHEYMIELTNPRNGWWQLIDVENAEEAKEVKLKGSPTGKYWIHHSVVCLGTRNYGGERWCLKASPAAKAKATFWFKEEILLHPLDVKGNWVKVVTHDKKHTGWIEMENLCDNPLTNCC